MTIYILGAGPTGLAVADSLKRDLKGHHKFVIIERNKLLGGLASTIKWKSIGHHDLGPHKIFSLDKNLRAKVEKILTKEEWITQKKSSKIFLKGHYLDYPPSPFSFIKIYGLKTFFLLSFGYSFALIKSLIIKDKKIDNFEDDIKRKVGSEFYSILFKQIAFKFWGDPKNLDIKLSKNRIQLPSMLEIFKKILNINKKTSKFEAINFKYPKNGLRRLWYKIYLNTRDIGKFNINETIKNIELSNDAISKLTTIKGEKTKDYIIKKNDFIVSTLPLNYTYKILFPQKDKNLDHFISFNDLYLFFFHLDVDCLFEESWFFFPESQISFHRISEQNSFDKSMINYGTILCCEVMNNKFKNFDKKKDDELFEIVENDLNKLKLKKFKILSKKIIKLKQSYPVYIKGYNNALNNILNDLDQIKNFKSIGRQGSFNYIGTLDAMDIGYGFVNWLKDKNINEWENERKRTENFPVLD